tara:strand:- start:11517 stop:12824 length:1308 start_codon:yes stop_codon:yes gene_type:complete
MKIYISAVFCLISFISIAQNNKRSPNIILIMADDLGFECINSYGGTSYDTPNLSILAESGLQFENCHSQPLCTPSRVKLMTGKSNKKNYKEFGILDPNEKTFSQILRKNGYATMIAGKWQLGKIDTLPKHFGFDEHLLWQLSDTGRDSIGRDKRYVNPVLKQNGVLYEKNEGKYSTDMIVEYINNFMDRKKKQPFLVYYPMILTHCPFDPTPNSKDWDPNDMGSMTYKGNAKYFKDMVNYMDYSIGRIVKKIEKLGLRQNTIILFTGDNGTDKPVVSMMDNISVIGGKGQTTDYGTHVPLIVNWKGTVKSNSKSESLIDFSDFFPTICDLANIPLDSTMGLDGISFYPELIGKTGPKRKWIHSWYNRNGGLNPLVSSQEWVRNESYKMYVGDKFYNIKEDPYEKNNIPFFEMSDQEKKIREEFLEVLNSYTYLRN